MERRQFNLGLLALLSGACGSSAPQWPPIPEAGVTADPTSNFHKIYDDPELRERFYPFVVNVFHLYPEEEFHKLIEHVTRAFPSDQQIYSDLLRVLPSISPVGGTARFGLPALKKQKREMALQAGSLLGSDTVVDGYLEMGTTGRYYHGLAERIDLTGPIYVLNDVAPSKSPADVADRGQLASVGDYIDLADYAPLSADVPDASLDLVSNLIGFHHCPDDKLEAFVEGLRRPLREGGRLLLREHDVTDDTMNALVSLAHDVFNAGLLIPWGENHAQVRGFRSAVDWTVYLERRGFKLIPSGRRQFGDPTDNTMLVFKKS